MDKRLKNGAELAWVLGIILCPLGVCLSAKSGLGVSMVVAPAYVLYLKLSQFFSWFTLGMAEYLFQGLLIAITSIVLRRFKWKYLLCFVTAVLCGIMIDVWGLLVGTEVCTVFWQQCIYCVCGALVTGFAVSLMLRTYLPQEVFELVVKEISDRFSFSVNRVKWVYDISSLLLAILLMLCLFGRFSFDMVGIGTLFVTVVNTPIITLFGKLIDKLFVFNSAFPKFYEKFEKIMD